MANDFAAQIGAEMTSLANAATAFAKISPTAITLCESIEFKDTSAVAVLSCGTTNGLQIGAGSVTQKVGFYNATPIVQRAGAAQDAVVTTGAGLAAYGYTEAQANAIVALVNECRAALVAVGLIKGSA